MSKGRKRLTRSASKGKFRKTSGIHKLNKVNRAQFRGGIRL